MEKLTASVKPEHLYELEARQRLGNADSRSAALRQILDDYQELRSDYEALESEYADLKQRYEAREDRIEDLEEQLSKRSQIEEKIEELPDKVRASAMTYSERRQRAIDRASPVERLKWKVTGVPEERIDEIGEEDG
jgi:chromosome segregation ATPase